MRDTLKAINLAEFLNRHYGASFNMKNTHPTSLCIFHDDTNPSLKYNEEHNTVICWSSCHASDEIPPGRPIDIFTCVSLKEGLDIKTQFVDIMQKICELENITYKGNNISQEEVNLYKYNSSLTKKYIDNLRSPDNVIHEVHTYLSDRGIDKQTIVDFFLGLTSQNEEKFGIANSSNKLSIPILSDDGTKVLSICKRELPSGVGQNKYMHSKTDIVWKKSNVLYGFSHAKELARSTGEVYVVEGFFDLYSLYQIGIKNVVSTMGLNLTEVQCLKLKKIAKTVVFILDQDNAGMKSAKGNVNMCVKHNLNVDIIPSLEFNGKDMNDVCIKLKWKKKELVDLLCRNRVDGIQYLLSPIISGYSSVEMKAKMKAFEEGMKLIDTMEDGYKKEVYLSEFKKKINM